MADASFDGYVVTTTNPGSLLLVVTIVVCLLFFVGGCILIYYKDHLSSLIKKSVPCISKISDNQEAENQNKYQLDITNEEVLEHKLNFFKSKKLKSFKQKRYGGVKGMSSVNEIKRVSAKKVKANRRIIHVNSGAEKKKVKVTMKLSKPPASLTRIGRFEEKLDFKDFSIWKGDSARSISDGTFAGLSFNGDRMDVDDESVLSENSASVADSASGLSPEELIEKEGRKVFGLAGPWMLQSFVTDVSDIIYMMMISHFLGLGEMICWSSVWFILGMAHFITDSWHSSVYKHLVAAVAQDTNEGYVLAGKYMQIGACGKIVVMVPVSIIITWFMPEIMDWIGYDVAIVDMSRSFAAIASISQIVNSEVFSSLLEIEGYARFNALYDFWESIICLLFVFVFVLLFRPGLLAFALFNCCLSVTSVIYYVYLTYEKRGMFDEYMEGMISPLDIKKLTPVRSMARTAVPIAIYSASGYVNSMAFALFASYQGAAETATWILLGYVWAVVETIPECFASAATVRVEHLLTNGHLSAAKEIARRAIALSTITSILFSIILLDTRRYLAWSLCLDETLEMMILEIIPYIALCQPLITAGVAANSLNEVLGKYSLSVGLSSVVDLCFTIPMGAIFTYSMNFNIESLASAQCMGYAATGMINLIIFSYTNWEYARSKILQYIEE